MPNTVQRWRSVPMFALAALLALSSPPGATAWAQGSLPDEIITAPTTLSGGQLDRLRAFTGPISRSLGSGDSELLSEARAAVVRAVQGPSVSVAFRNALSRELEPTLERLITNGTPVEQINALRLAGEIATTRTADFLTRSLSADNRGVRYAAAAGLARSFDAVRVASPALGRQRITGLVDELAARLRTEQDPAIFDAVVRALATAGAIDRQGYEAIRGHAFTSMSDAAADRILADRAAGLTPGPETLRAWLRAVDAARNAILRPPGLDPQARRSAARLAGVQLRWAGAWAEGGMSGGEATGELVRAMVAASEAVIYLIHSPATQTPSLADAMARGQREALLAGVEALVGAQGALTRAPFNLDAGALGPAD